MAARPFTIVKYLLVFAVLSLVFLHTLEAKSFIITTLTWHLEFYPAAYKFTTNVIFALCGFFLTSFLNAKEDAGGFKLSSYFKTFLRSLLPYYFLSLFLGLWVYPQSRLLIPAEEYQELQRYFAQKVIFFAIMLPQVAQSNYTPVPLLSHLWIIGVIFQFGLFWPLIWRTPKNRTSRCWLFLVVMALFQYFLGSINAQAFDSSVSWSLIKLQEYFAQARFFYLALGGCLALVLHAHTKAKPDYSAAPRAWVRFGKFIYSLFLNHVVFSYLNLFLLLHFSWKFTGNCGESLLLFLMTLLESSVLTLLLMLLPL